MGKIWDLIKNEKVEWKSLSEICEITTGKLNANKSKENGEYPFFTCNEKPLRIDSWEFDLDAILISGNGSRVGHINEYNGKFNAYQRTYVLYNFKKCTKNFILHYLHMNFRKFIFNQINNDSIIPFITKNVFSDFKIPIPSIETQNKIVKILDKFNIYVKELEHELEHRNKQYQYYNELCFNDDFLKFLSNKYAAESIVENKTLNQLGVFIRGNNLTKKEIKNSGQPVVRYGELHTKYKFETDFTYSFTNNDLFKKLKKAIKNDLMIVLTSEDNDGVCKTCIWSGDYEIGISSDMCIFRGNVNPYFLNHFFSTKRFLKQKEKYLSGTNIIRISTDNLGKIDISLPSIVLQNLVSEKLNKLYKISNSIYEGLPKEIKLRKQQYEYYRNKLLDFPKN
ncbi:restriction endonuclease subunit S [Mycoplasmopsis anatis]|uniref:Type I restriction system specificity protein n=1 Tax=Mycoplasmopsis anatis 1340 TaxID=1034808 RepID=F9QCY8_9BACT|nr:restriction endonuclease subunit S [Mycoplasmopsis anatis]AWX70487.1 restriction endonuclease subunit S [Mycoplasmopsis anatis]EGS29370.1 type I restriction system specificity protein [Mycoplasmopsis anatis 1340]VEU73849.1 Type I restriction enzyme specificity protein [Mycoplasmopsis anatis]